MGNEDLLNKRILMQKNSVGFNLMVK